MNLAAETSHVAKSVIEAFSRLEHTFSMWAFSGPLGGWSKFWNKSGQNNVLSRLPSKHALMFEIYLDESYIAAYLISSLVWCLGIKNICVLKNNSKIPFLAAKGTRIKQIQKKHERHILTTTFFGCKRDHIQTNPKKSMTDISSPLPF